MSRGKRIDAYLQETLELLEDDRFDVFEGERYEGRRFRAIATKVQGFRFGSQELVFVFARFAQLTDDKLQDFIETAFAYAKETRRSTWPLGLNNVLWVYPVALAEEATDRVVGRIREENPDIQGFGYVAFPAIYDAAADEVCFYEGNAGLLASRAMNKVARFAEKYLLLA
jgi:hypothetical protein